MKTLPISAFKWLPEHRMLCASLDTVHQRFAYYKHDGDCDLIVYNPKTKQLRYFYYLKQTRKAWVYKSDDHITIKLYKGKPQWKPTDHPINQPEHSGIERNFFEQMMDEMIEDFEPEEIYL